MLIAAVMSATVTSRRGVVTRQREHAEHPVGAVDERQALLGFEHTGSMPGVGERRRGVDTHSVHHDLPLAEEDQSDVREGREITAASQRSVLGHPRRDARREQCEQAVDEQRADAAMGHRQRSRAQQHHGPHDFGLDGFAEAGCVRPDQGRLEAGPVVGLDVHIGERAEAGRDAIHRLAGAG